MMNADEWTSNKPWRRRPLGRAFSIRDVVLHPKRMIISQDRAWHIESSSIRFLK